MSTALIMFSVFFTGAIAIRRDTGGSNTLIFCALISLLTGVGMWGYAFYRHAA